MRRALALALIGGAAYAGWRYWQAGGLGGAPSAGASMGALEAYAPTGLRKEFDEEDATAAIGGLFASGWRLGDPHEGAAVLAQIPVASLASQVAALADAGRANLSEGIRTTKDTTPADRRVLAEAECRRASVAAGLPSWLIDDCTRGVSLAHMWTYFAPRARVGLHVDIGGGGLPAGSPFQINHGQIGAVSQTDPATGRPMSRAN